MTGEKNSKHALSAMDEGEAIVNFRSGCAIMQQNGDTEGLAKAKKEHPELYADWEKRHAAAKIAQAEERDDDFGVWLAQNCGSMGRKPDARKSYKK